MAVKIKVSYQHCDELEEVIKRLNPLKGIKVAKNENGGYKKAYIDIDIIPEKSESLKGV